MNIFGEYVAAPDAVRTAEKKLFQDGVSEDALIERAAGKLASAVKAAANREEKIIVVAGGGNNGCDGLECARILKADGYDVSVFSASGKKKFRKRRKAAKAVRTWRSVFDLRTERTL